MSVACRDNSPVMVVTEILAGIVLDKIGIVVANDSARSSFTVAAVAAPGPIGPGSRTRSSRKVITTPHNSGPLLVRLADGHPHNDPPLRNRVT